MTPFRRRPPRDLNGRRGVRRAVVLMPNGLTLFNLFCGIYAIILAIHKEFAAAPGFIVLGGIADALDGRVARATGTGSRFGEELDSLVDAISFGFAPAMIVYLSRPPETQNNLDWLLVFIFTACAVMRLARFNVEQAGRAKTHFHGLPSPAAGLTLASYYWFSQTPLYNQTVILFTDSRTLASLPWPNMMRGLMALLAALMVSDVPYPAFPSIGYKSLKKILGTLLILGSLALLVVRREEFIFPALLAYVAYGIVKWMIIGLLGRSSTPDQIFWEREAELHQAEDPNDMYDRPPIAQEAIEDVEDEEAVAVKRASSSRRERGDRRDDRREGSRDGSRDSKREHRREPQRDAQREAKREAKREAQREAQREERRKKRREEQRQETQRAEKPVAAPVVAPIVVPSVDGPQAELPDLTEEITREEQAESARTPDEAARARKRRRRRGGRGNRQRGERGERGERTDRAEGDDASSGGDQPEASGGDDSPSRSTPPDSSAPPTPPTPPSGPTE